MQPPIKKQRVQSDSAGDAQDVQHNNNNNNNSAINLSIRDESFVSVDSVDNSFASATIDNFFTSNNTAKSFASVSHSKLSDNDSFEIQEHPPCGGYRFMAMSVLSGVLENLLCPDCHINNLSLTEKTNQRKGAASYIVVHCDCGYEHSFYTSLKQQYSFDVNKRLVYAMRSCGQGFSGMEGFTSLMNMP